MRRLTAVVLLLTPLPLFSQSPKKVVLIAGPKSHGPVGNGIHDYGWSVKLLKTMLEHSNIKDRVRVEIHADGWPKHPKTLEDADTIMVISDGRDGDQYQEAPHLASDERVRFVAAQMKRGCGFLTFHFSTFAPQKYAKEVMGWNGGYFQWEQEGKRQWYSAITSVEAEVKVSTPEHPVARGLKPFKMKEEFYYNLRLAENVRPIWVVPSLPGREPDGGVVAWACERADGGRGLGTTCGHFYDNWKHDQFRKLILNALAWTAKVEIPPGGVEARFFTHEEITRHLGTTVHPDPLSEGKFGNALDARAGGAFVTSRNEYREPPLTAECWAQVTGRERYHIFLSNELKTSATHWELFAEAGNGRLTAYLPGYTPDHVRTQNDVTDDKWHHVRLIFEPTRVRLTVDGQVAADVPVKFNGGKTVEGRFAIGSLVGKELGCGGLIDDVRLERGVPDSLAVPSKPVPVTEKTIGLWRFDAIDNGRVSDESPLKNAATFEASATPQAAAGPSSPDRLDYAPVDPRFRVTLIDRSPDDAYMGVKCDSKGQLFVGGREGLWVFEPDGRGQFKPRRELYRFPKDSIILGIEVRGNDLYVLTASALYLFSNGRVKRDGLKPKRLLWGLPLDLHVSFHCLAWGPEGDLYVNHGDPLLNYGDFNRPDHWGHWTYYLVGGKKVPYTGTGAVLRIKPDGTSLRVVATGLRGPVGLCFDKNWNLFTNDNDHESIPDRYGYARLLHVVPGIDFAWPRGWMASKSPERSDLIEPMVPSMGRGVPVGLAYVDEPALGLSHQLLQCRWDQRAIRRYPITPRGSTFAAEELPFVDGQHIARPTGLCAARGGRLFATVHYLAGNIGSPHGVSDLIMIAPADDKVVPAGWLDLTKANDAALKAELASASWQRRLEAHQESLRRGGTGLGTPAVHELAPDKVLEAIAGEDPYLRQLATSLLIRQESLAELERLAKSANPSWRLAGVLAAGARLTVLPSDFVPPPEVKLSHASGNAFFALQYAEEWGPIDLRTRGRVGSFTFAEYWKAIKPTREQQRLRDLLVAAATDRSAAVSGQAQYYLSLLGDPGLDAQLEEWLEQRIRRQFHDPVVRAALRVWTVGPFPDGDEGFAKVHPPETGPIDLAAKYTSPQGPLTWENADLEDRPAHGRAASRYVYFQIQSPDRRWVDLSTPTEGRFKVWHNGRAIWEGTRERPLLIDAQPGSNDILIRLTKSARTIYVDNAGGVRLVLPDKLDAAAMAKRLRGANGDERVPAELLDVTWAEEMKKGDAANGRRLFGALACAKCHAVVAEQKGGGAPSLADAAKRFTVPHVVESILLPSKQVAELFRASRIELKTGQSLSGLIVAETAEQIEVLLADGSRKTIALGEIEERKLTAGSPMPAGLVKTRAELRDLLAYLFSAKLEPP